jgi:hypothetical protein
MNKAAAAFFYIDCITGSVQTAFFYWATAVPAAFESIS